MMKYLSFIPTYGWRDLSLSLSLIVMSNNKSTQLLVQSLLCLHVDHAKDRSLLFCLPWAFIPYGHIQQNGVSLNSIGPLL